MLPSPFYDEVPADLGGDEVWVRAQATGDDEAGPLAAGKTLLQRLLSVLCAGLGATAGPGRSAMLRQPCR
jgi:hypothetical protein